MRANRILAGLALALAALAFTAPADGQVSLEYAVKAAYLTKFAPFIDWPDGVFAGPGAPVSICILGNDPFGAMLDKAAAAGSGGRPIAIRRLAANDPAEGCQIVFTGDADAALDGLRGKPVVTVTDSGMPGRGIISFVMQDNHVRFDIDDAGAQTSGLRISSKLLELAHSVSRRPRP
jgi:YfiR/HmsC-like